MRLSLLSVVATLYFSTWLAVHAEPIRQWTKENVAGLKLSLEHPQNSSAIGEMDFLADGVVKVGLGRGAAPAFEWKWSLVNGKLRTEDRTGDIIGEFTLISMDSSTVTIKNSKGDTIKYKIIKDVKIDPNRELVERKLNYLIIDKCNFDNADVQVVLDYLTSQSKRLDPDKKGFTFTLRLPTNTPSNFNTVHREVKMTMENIPMDDFLRFLCEQTNLTYEVEGNAIVFVPKESDLAPVGTNN